MTSVCEERGKEKGRLVQDEAQSGVAEFQSRGGKDVRKEEVWKRKGGEGGGSARYLGTCGTR